MLKPIFQLIGFLVVILILLLAVLFYLDGKDLLSGELADFIGSLRALYVPERNKRKSSFERRVLEDIDCQLDDMRQELEQYVK